MQNDCSRFKQTASTKSCLIAIEKINFTANLDRAGNTRIYFSPEEAKETVSDFSPGTVKNMWMCYRMQLNTVSSNNLIFINIKWHNTTV